MRNDAYIAPKVFLATLPEKDGRALLLDLVLAHT
jgi:hypothetical protein